MGTTSDTKYTEHDAAKDTGVSNKEAFKNFHKARDDSGVREGNDRENFSSSPSWAESIVSWFSSK